MEAYAVYQAYKDLKNDVFFRFTYDTGNGNQKGKNKKVRKEVYKVQRDPANRDKKSYNRLEATCWDIDSDGHPVRICLHIPKFYDAHGNEYAQATVYPGCDSDGPFPGNCTRAYMMYVLKDYWIDGSGNVLSSEEFKAKHHFSHLATGTTLIDIMHHFACKSEMLIEYGHGRYYPGTCFAVHHFQMWSSIVTLVTRYASDGSLVLVDAIADSNPLGIGQLLADRINPEGDTQVFASCDIDLINTLHTLRPDIRISIDPDLPNLLLYLLGTDRFAHFTLYKALQDIYGQMMLQSDQKGLTDFYCALLAIITYIEASESYIIGKHYDIRQYEGYIEDIFHSLRGILNTPVFPLCKADDALIPPRYSMVALYEHLYQTLYLCGKYSIERILLTLQCKPDFLKDAPSPSSYDYGLIYGKRRSVDSTWLMPLYTLPDPATQEEILGSVLSGLTRMRKLFAASDIELPGFRYVGLNEPMLTNLITGYLPDAMQNPTASAQTTLNNALKIHSSCLRITQLDVLYRYNSPGIFEDLWVQSPLELRVLFDNNTGNISRIILLSGDGTRKIPPVERIAASLEACADSAAQSSLDLFFNDYMSVIESMTDLYMPYRRKLNQRDNLGRDFLNLEDAVLPQGRDHYMITMRLASGYDITTIAEATTNRADGWEAYGQAEWQQILYYLWKFALEENE